MWIASILGWFSVVVDNQRSGRMLVRARCKADIENLYEANRDLASIEAPTSDATRDYRWRLSVSKEDWIQIATRLADGVTYSNFKSAVHDQPSQSNKSMAYLRIWQTMMDVQRADRDVEDDDRLGHANYGVPWKSPTNEPTS